MKKVIIVLTNLLIITSIFAQSPEKISYQAIVRNSSDELVVDANIGMQISILQGSINGTAVYVEKHLPTANANGLVSLEIGNGTLVSGDFSAINWSNGDYFIKTETDLNGGDNYTITGTSQLLSVPYALYAKVADNGITPTQSAAIKTNSLKISYPKADATKLAGIESGAEVNVQADWNQTSNKVDSYIKNKPNIDGSETKITAGTNITITGVGTKASPYVVNVKQTTGLALGQRYQGGRIFYLTPDKQHGLIAETVDQSSASSWVDAQSTISDPGNHPDEGKNYTDWRLPTRYELNILYIRRNYVGGFSNASYYWSSTRSTTNVNYIWVLHFGTREEQQMGSSGGSCRIRAIRSF